MKSTQSTKSRASAVGKRARAKKTSLAVERELIENVAGTSYAPSVAVVKLAKFAREKKENNVELGERVAKLRVFLSFNRQQDFATALAVSRAAVGNWERGVGVSRASLDQIAVKFNASLEWLLTGKGEMIVGSNEKRFAKPLKRMKLLPPDDYQEFEEQVLALLDAKLRHVERRDGRGS